MWRKSCENGEVGGMIVRVVRREQADKILNMILGGN